MDTIIPTNVNYNSSILNKNLQTLKSLYPFLEVGTAGKSIIGQDIPYVKIGNGQKQVFYSASIHAKG